MPFKRTPQVFNASVGEVTLGTGDNTVTIGGENVFPLYSFDAPIKNKVALGVEIWDTGVDQTVSGISKYYDGCNSLAEIASKAQEMPGASFIALSLVGADPTGLNKSVDEIVANVGEVLSAITCPLVVLGCKNIEKDTAMFEKIAETYQGKNILFVSCREEDYKVLSASLVMAYNHKISAESAVDINLAKQLNVLMSQMGIQRENHVMNIGSAAAGYGYEYVASTFDRVRGAALAQNDTSLQMPIITPVASEAWSVKEALVSEEDIPEWGPRENRGIQMEISTGASAICGGANAVVLRHPQSIQTLSRFVDELC